jgi:hypothetical protein
VCLRTGGRRDRPGKSDGARARLLWSQHFPAEGLHLNQHLIGFQLRNWAFLDGPHLRSTILLDDDCPIAHLLGAQADERRGEGRVDLCLCQVCQCVGEGLHRHAERDGDD